MMETIFGSAPPIWAPLPMIGRPPSSAGLPLASVMSPGFPSPYPPGPTLASNLVGDPHGIVTASSLLAAVAWRRGQPQGPSNDHEVEDFIYDALDLLPGAADVDVRCENGRATLTGSVQHKRTKRDVGEIAWAIPALQDVQNNVSVASRRRGRANREGRESDVPSVAAARKQS